MTTKLRLLLEDSIESFLEEIYDDCDRPNGLIYPELKEHMTQAAELVFDAAMKSSIFTSNEYGD